MGLRRNGFLISSIGGSLVNRVDAFEKGVSRGAPRPKTLVIENYRQPR